MGACGGKRYTSLQQNTCLKQIKAMLAHSAMQCINQPCIVSRVSWVQTAHVEHSTFCKTALHRQYVCRYKQMHVSLCLQITVVTHPTRVQALPMCLVSLLAVCMQAPHANGFQQRTLADIILQKIQDKERAQGQASTSGYAPLHCIHSSCITVIRFRQNIVSPRVYSSESRVSRGELKGTKLRLIKARNRQYPRLDSLGCVILVQSRSASDAMTCFRPLVIDFLGTCLCLRIVACKHELVMFRGSCTIV